MTQKPAGPGSMLIHTSCLARDHDLACRATNRALYLHVHVDAWVMAQSYRGLFLQPGAFGAAPHPRQLQRRTQGTPDRLHQRHQSRASSPHLALQNRQCSMTPIGALFWKHRTKDLSQRVADFALSKPRRGQERKCQPYSCPKDERQKQQHDHRCPWGKPCADIAGRWL
jgi:hypothetical protein